MYFFDGSEYKNQFKKLNNILTRTSTLSWEKICQLYIYHSVNDEDTIDFDPELEELRVGHLDQMI